jgi:hypothetical protein
MLARIDLPEIAGPDAFNDIAARERWPVLCDSSCSFRHPSLLQVLQVWQATAGADGIPRRQAMTPRKLQPFMRSLAIYERMFELDGAPRYRVRLFGGGWVEFYGEMTGRFLDELVPPAFLPRWHALPDTAFGAGAPVRIVARCDTFGKAYMMAEILCAPMRADDGAVRFALLAAQFDGTQMWDEVEAEERRRLGRR